MKDFLPCFCCQSGYMDKRINVQVWFWFVDCKSKPRICTMKNYQVGAFRFSCT
ncbi:hypothetical protein DsansV1_C38g0236061 [Dioscorea sansibarensis]